MQIRVALFPCACRKIWTQYVKYVASYFCLRNNGRPNRTATVRRVCFLGRLYKSTIRNCAYNIRGELICMCVIYRAMVVLFFCEKCSVAIVCKRGSDDFGGVCEYRICRIFVILKNLYEIVRCVWEMYGSIYNWRRRGFFFNGKIINFILFAIFLMILLYYFQFFYNMIIIIKHK